MKKTYMCLFVILKHSVQGKGYKALEQKYNNDKIHKSPYRILILNSFFGKRATPKILSMEIIKNNVIT